MKYLGTILFSISLLYGVSITFRVHVQPNTPLTDTVYIVGNIPELGNWNPHSVPMTREGYYEWTIAVDVASGTEIQYKYTRGSWLTVEKDFWGNEIPNRVLTVLDSTTVYDTVQSWRDIPHPFDREPYLSFLEDPHTSFTISFEREEACTVFVAYGLQTLSDTIMDTTYSAKHIITVNGLTPGETYHYKVLTSTGYESQLYTVKTAPTNDTFSFVIFGDTRTDSGAHQRVVNAILQYNPAFVIHTGDLVADGKNISQWNTFFNIEKELMANSPFISAVGNHEDPEDPETKYYYLFAMPGNEKWFSFNYGPIHFIALDTECDLWGEERDWLISDLESVQNDPSIKWIMVFYHRPPYSSGSHGSYTNVREAFSPLFEQYGVNFSFCGHEHDYERTIPIGGVVYFVTGGGGAPLYGVGTSYFTAYSQSIHHFLLIHVDWDTLTIWAIDSSGVPFDSMKTTSELKPLEPNLTGSIEYALSPGLLRWNIYDTLTILRDDGTHGDSVAGDGIYTLRLTTQFSLPFAPSTMEGIEIVRTTGLVSPMYPGFTVPVWFSQGDTIRFYLDTNHHDDGFLPESMIVYHSKMVNEPWPTYFVVGDCQDELGGISDWNVYDTTLCLHDDGMNGDSVAGDLIYTVRAVSQASGIYHFKILSHPGQWYPQFTKFGYITNSQFSGEVEFEIEHPGDTVYFFLDARRGRIRVSTIPAGVEEGSNDIGICNFIELFPVPGRILKVRVKTSYSWEIDIYDESGRSVISPIKGNGRKTFLIGENLTRGVYFLKFSYKRGHIVKKIVIF